MLTLAKYKGDTLVEVLFAVAVFSAIAVGSISIMNQGVATSQNALEVTLVRNNIDSQAELLRHLQNAKLTSIGRSGSLSSGSSSTESGRLAAEWDKITSNLLVDNAGDYSRLMTFEQCDLAAINDNFVIANTASDLAKVFFINTRDGSVYNYGSKPDSFRVAQTFAQVRQPENIAILDNPVSEMVWIQAVKSSSDVSTLNNTVAYDFHIRACWQGSGTDFNMMKLGTIVRLYMPKEGH